MTVQAIAIVNSEGHIETMYVPGTTYPDNNSAWDQDNTKTIVHITSGFSNISAFMSLKYYKDGAWKDRSSSPADYYDWKGEAWVLNSAALWVKIRRDRDARLASCDWTQVSDSPLSTSKKAEWAEYRQALRSVPANNSGVSHLNSVVWPDIPS